MSRVWFTSDTHFGHANVIKYSDRPFSDVVEMDEMIVKAWNERVQPGDLVYHLGDFALSKPSHAIRLAKRLLGQKYLIFGNHDKRLRKDKEFLKEWIWARDLEQITIDGQKITLCHFAMVTWNKSHHGAWQLHGHSHGSLPDDPHALRLDVGVDCWGYAPVSFEEIRMRMGKKTFRPIDHHGRDDEEE